MSPIARTARRMALGATLMSLAAVSLSACGEADAEASGPVLRVGVQADGIRAVLEQSGALEGASYTLEYAEFTAGPPIVEAAAADQIDVSWVGSTPPIFGAAAGAGFKVIAETAEDDQKENSILVPEGSDIKTVGDLKGKSVAVGRATSAHGFRLNALDDAGLTLGDVTPNYLAPADGLAAFTSGSVDAWVVWDPYVTQAIQDNGAVEIVGGSPFELGTQFVIASTGALDDPETRELVADYTERLQQAFAWAHDNPDAWGEGWAEESGLSPEVTNQVARNKALVVQAVSEDTISYQQGLADAFYDAGELEKEIDFSTIVDNVL